MAPPNLLSLPAELRQEIVGYTFQIRGRYRMKPGTEEELSDDSITFVATSELSKVCRMLREDVQLAKALWYPPNGKLLVVVDGPRSFKKLRERYQSYSGSHRTGWIGFTEAWYTEEEIEGEINPPFIISPAMRARILPSTVARNHLIGFVARPLPKQNQGVGPLGWINQLLEHNDAQHRRKAAMVVHLDHRYKIAEERLLEAEQHKDRITKLGEENEKLQEANEHLTVENEKLREELRGVLPRSAC